MALLHLCAPLKPRVATVNHHLRPEAGAEAEMVAATCRDLGLDHVTLDWHWDGRGNLSDAARRGRRDLLAAWNPLVVLAHTQDDLAETFLMRLMRGAGVDGLAAMSARFAYGGATFLRPLLAVSRQDLRSFLTLNGLSWIEDPTNLNPHYLRPRIRKALADLPGQDIAASARHLAEARAALESLADTWAGRAFVQDRGTLIVQESLWEAPTETRRRLLTRAILWLAPAPYGPRGAALTRLEEALRAGRDATLAGVRFARGRAFREARALPPPVPVGQIWDGIWSAKAPPDCHIAALGEAIAACPGSDLPRAAQRAAPAIWQGDRLLAAPFSGLVHPEVTLSALRRNFDPLTGALSH